MSQDTDEWIIELYEQGKSATETAKEIGVSYTTVLRRLRRLRWEKRIPQKYNLPSLKQSTRYGKIAKVLEDLNEEDQVWLLSNTPTDCSVAEYLATIVKEKIHGK